MNVLQKTLEDYFSEVVFGRLPVKVESTVLKRTRLKVLDCVGLLSTDIGLLIDAASFVLALVSLQCSKRTSWLSTDRERCNSLAHCHWSHKIADYGLLGFLGCSLIDKDSYIFFADLDESSTHIYCNEARLFSAEKFSWTSTIHPGIFLERVLWADGVTLRMNTIASRDQFKPIRIGENLVRIVCVRTLWSVTCSLSFVSCCSLPS